MTHEPVAYQIEDANGEFMCLSRTKSTIRGVTSKPLYDAAAQHAEIARLTAENEALLSAVSEAVAAERMVCAELMEQQHTWITNVAASALIRARGAALPAPCRR